MPFTKTKLLSSVPSQFSFGNPYLGHPYAASVGYFNNAYLSTTPVSLGTYFTIEGWFRAATAGTGNIATYGTAFYWNGPQPGQSFDLSLGSGRASYFWGYSGPGTNTFGSAGSAVGPTTIPLTTWLHLAVVRNGGWYGYFVNGSLVATKNGGGIFTPGGSFYLGYQPWGGTFFNGHMSDFMISNNAKYTSNFATPASYLPVTVNTVLSIPMRSPSTPFIDVTGNKTMSNSNVQFVTA